MNVLQRKILKYILSVENVSKASISKKMNISKSAIGKQVNELVQAGIVYEDGTFFSSGLGRRHERLKVKPESFYACGMSLASRSLDICLIDASLGIVHIESYAISFDFAKLDKSFCEIIECFNLFMAKSRIKSNKITAIGVSCSGIVDCNTGDLLRSGSLCIKERIPLGKELEERLKIPVFVEETVNTQAHYEYNCGIGRGVKNMLFTSCQSGCSGIIINGELFHGTACRSGQTDKYIVDQQGPISESGQRGTLSSYFSISAFLKQVEQVPCSERNYDLLKIRTEAEFKKAYKMGNPIICQIVKEASSYAAFFFYNIMTLLPMDIIVVDNWLGAQPECCLDIIKHELRRHADFGLEVKVGVSSCEEDKRCFYISCLALMRSLAGKTLS